MSFTAKKIESALRRYLADMHYSLAKAMSGFGLHLLALLIPKGFLKACSR